MACELPRNREARRNVKRTDPKQPCDDCGSQNRGSEAERYDSNDTDKTQQHFGPYDTIEIPTAHGSRAGFSQVKHDDLVRLPKPEDSVHADETQQSWIEQSRPSHDESASGTVIAAKDRYSRSNEAESGDSNSQTRHVRGESLQ